MWDSNDTAFGAFGHFTLVFISSFEATENGKTLHRSRYVGCVGDVTPNKPYYGFSGYEKKLSRERKERK